MEIRFASSRTAKLCNSQNEMRGRLDPQCAQRLQQRLEELCAAASLADMRFLPASRCHQLAQDRRGKLAVNLVQGRRLVFEPAHNPLPVKADGGLDWSRVTRIQIVEVIDYH